MASYTDKLKLFKYDPEQDGESVFSINQALNENWDKIDGNWNSVDDISNKLTGFVKSEEFVDCSVVIESFNNGTSWYRIWSDGYMMMGGTQTRASVTEAVSFLKTFSAIPHVFSQAHHTSSSTDGRPPLVNTITTTGFVYNSYTGYASFSWVAMGYYDLENN